MDSVIRTVSALTVRLDLLLSFIRKKKAEPRLARMIKRATPTKIFMGVSLKMQCVMSMSRMEKL